MLLLATPRIRPPRTGVPLPDESSPAEVLLPGGAIDPELNDAGADEASTGAAAWLSAPAESTAAVEALPVEAT